MRDFTRWGTVLAMLSSLMSWVRRWRRKSDDPYTLGTLSDEWFWDRRYDL
jgi:hypothetical protein